MSDQEETDEEETDEEPIPKLPRASLFGKPSFPALVRIAMFATFLYMMIMMRQPCSEGVGRFIGTFGAEPDAGAASAPSSYEGFELITAEEALKRWPDHPDNDAQPHNAIGKDAGPETAVPETAVPETAVPETAVP